MYLRALSVEGRASVSNRLQVLNNNNIVLCTVMFALCKLTVHTYYGRTGLYIWANAIILLLLYNVHKSFQRDVKNNINQFPGDDYDHARVNIQYLCAAVRDTLISADIVFVWKVRRLASILIISELAMMIIVRVKEIIKYTHELTRSYFRSSYRVYPARI